MAAETSMPIAVVAVNCRLPGGATNPEKFWDLLINQTDAWTEIPKERFNASGFYQSTVGNGASVSRKSFPNYPKFLTGYL